MSSMFEFFLEMAAEFFAFIGSAEIFSNFTILDFSVGLFIINLIITNFILLGKRYKADQDYEANYRRHSAIRDKIKAEKSANNNGG